VKITVRMTEAVSYQKTYELDELAAMLGRDGEQLCRLAARSQHHGDTSDLGFGANEGSDALYEDLLAHFSAVEDRQWEYDTSSGDPRLVDPSAAPTGNPSCAFATSTQPRTSHE
jgi:hypothetical protein